LARYASPAIVDFVAGVGFMTHWDGFMRGVVDLRDVVYFLSVMTFGLFVTGVVLRNRRA
jgi:ABC-2 type transport system permease protein